MNLTSEDAKLRNFQCNYLIQGLSDDGDLALCGTDRIRVYNFENIKLIRCEIALQNNSSVRDLAWKLFHGRKYLGICLNQSIQIWEIGTNFSVTKRLSVNYNSKMPIYKMSWISDGFHLLLFSKAEVLIYTINVNESFDSMLRIISMQEKSVGCFISLDTSIISIVDNGSLYHFNFLSGHRKKLLLSSSCIDGEGKFVAKALTDHNGYLLASWSLEMTLNLANNATTQHFLIDPLCVQPTSSSRVIDTTITIARPETAVIGGAATSRISMVSLVSVINESNEKSIEDDSGVSSGMLFNTSFQQSREGPSRKLKGSFPHILSGTSLADALAVPTSRESENDSLSEGGSILDSLMNLDIGDKAHVDSAFMNIISPRALGLTGGGKGRCGVSMIGEVDPHSPTQPNTSISSASSSSAIKCGKLCLYRLDTSSVKTIRTEDQNTHSASASIVTEESSQHQQIESSICFNSVLEIDLGSIIASSGVMERGGGREVGGGHREEGGRHGGSIDDPPPDIMSFLNPDMTALHIYGPDTIKLSYSMAKGSKKGRQERCVTVGWMVIGFSENCYVFLCAITTLLTEDDLLSKDLSSLSNINFKFCKCIILPDNVKCKGITFYKFNAKEERNSKLLLSVLSAKKVDSSLASSAIFSEYTKVRVQMIEIPLSDPHPEDLHDCEPASQSTDIAVVSNPSNITEVNNNSGEATARILELLMSMKESMESRMDGIESRLCKQDETLRELKTSIDQLNDVILLQQLK